MTESYNLGPDNVEVFSDEKIVWMGPAIYNKFCTYVPIAMEDGRVGYAIKSPPSDDRGQQMFLYFNPSFDDETDANVFTYHGEANHPALDGSYGVFVIVADERGVVTD